MAAGIILLVTWSVGCFWGEKKYRSVDMVIGGWWISLTSKLTSGQEMLKKLKIERCLEWTVARIGSAGASPGR